MHVAASHPTMISMQHSILVINNQHISILSEKRLSLTRPVTVNNPYQSHYSRELTLHFSGKQSISNQHLNLQ